MKLEVQFSSLIERKSIMRALQPDNINFPHGLVLEMHDNNEYLVIEIESSKIETVTNTIDEILQHISIAREVIND
ncbi:MAG: KEOPS complex subunit Pcc1 [Nitrososphaeraceae archaeon]